MYKALLVEIALGVAINVLMNTYWAYLILKQFYRVLTKKTDGSFDGDEKSDVQMKKMLDPKEPQSDGGVIKSD